MITLKQLSEQIKECYIDSVDEDMNFVQVVDAPRLFDIHLTLIVDLLERIDVLEDERDAQIRLRQKKYARR